MGKSLARQDNTQGRQPKEQKDKNAAVDYLCGRHGSVKNRYLRVAIAGTDEALVQLKPDRPREPTVKNLGQDGIVLA